MNTHIQLTDTKRIIKGVRLDYYGDTLLNISFECQRVYHPFAYQNISDKYETKSFLDHFGLN